MISNSNWDDRFHRAAKDGNLDLLSKANRKDARTRDEDGMTPTNWAAYYGNLAALRKIIERGGDPDKCDYLGNTALHCAAAKGHYNCVSYLINFGSNLWALDNDHRTAMDLASFNDRDDIVKLLDQALSAEKLKNPKIVRKQQEAAVLEADARIKEFEKRQKKLQERIKTEEASKRTNGHFGSKGGTFYQTIANKLGPVGFKDLSKSSSSGNGDPKEIPIIPSKNSQALFLSRTPKKAFDSTSVASDRTYKTDSGYGDDESAPGYFPIRSGLPGLNRAFMPRMRPIEADSLYSLSTNRKSAISEEDDLDSSGARAPSALDSSGSSSGYANRNEWNGCELSDEEDDGREEEDLKLFLAANGLTKFFPLFQKSQIDDMETLLLLTDSDLEKVGLELGPRKRLMQAILKFRADIEVPAEISNSRL